MFFDFVYLKAPPWDLKDHSLKSWRKCAPSFEGSHCAFKRELKKKNLDMKYDSTISTLESKDTLHSSTKTRKLHVPEDGGIVVFLSM